MPFFNNYITLNDPLGVLGTQATGINKHGQIVGFYVDANGQRNGFIYSQGTYTTIIGTQTITDANGGTHTYTYPIVPQGINDTDQIVGSFSRGGFLYNYNTGAFFPPGSYVDGTGGTQGINDQNVVVGSGNSTGVIYPNYQSSPQPGNVGNTTLVYPNATSTFANGINNQGVVVGSFVGSNTVADQLLYMNGVYLGQGFGGFSTYGEGINDFNQYVGFVVDSNGIAQGYVSTPGVSYAMFDVPGASSTYLYGINDAGEVVGAYVDDNGNTHGFLATVPFPSAPPATTTYTFRILNDPSAVFGTYAYGINKYGQIVGYYVDGNGQKNGFIYSQGTFTTITGTQSVTDANGGTHTYTLPIVPQGINDTDQIVGYFSGGGFLYNYNTGAFFPPGSYVVGTGLAQGINNQNVVVGSYSTSSSPGGPYSHGAIYPNYQSSPQPGNSGNTTLDYPNAPSTFADGINNQGMVVGYYIDSNKHAHQFTYANGTYASWDAPTANGATFGEGINDLGQAVGYYLDGGHNNAYGGDAAYGYVTTPQGNGQLSSTDIVAPGALGTYVYGINDAGAIVGAYVDANGSTHGFVATPVGQNSLPVVTPTSSALTLSAFHTVAASTLFTASDADGDTITQYDFWDSGSGGGHWLLNGAALGTNQDNIVSATQLSQIGYQSGTGTDTLWVRASDGIQFGNWSQAFTVSAPAVRLPTLNVTSDGTAQRGQTLALSILVTVSDPDQVGFQQLELWDSSGTVGGGQFAVNGVAQTGGHEIDVAPADMASTVFDVGTLGGTDTLWAQLLQKNGQTTGWQMFSVSAQAARLPSSSVTSNGSALRGQTLALSTLVTVSDPDHVGFQQLELWDSSGTVGGGQFVINGVAQTGGHEIDLAPANMPNTVFDVGTLGGADTLWAQLLQYNGQTTGWQMFTVTAPAARLPTLNVTSDGSAFRGQTRALSTLVTISDPDQVGFQKLELWDSNGTVGGGQFVVNGTAQTGGHEIDVSPANVANTVFDVGTSGGTDTLWAQLLENNGQTTGWQLFTVTAPPARLPTLNVTSNDNALRAQTLALSTLVNFSDPDPVGFQTLELWDSSGTVAGGQFVVNGTAQTGGHEIDVSPANVANTVFDVGTLGGTDTLWAQLLENNGQVTGWQNFSVTAPVARVPTLTASSNLSATPGQPLSLSTLVSIADPDHAGFQQLELWDSIGTAAGGQFVVNGKSQTGGHEIDVAASDVANTLFDVGTGGGTDTLYARLLQANGQLTPWQTFIVQAPLAMAQSLSGGPVTFTPASANRFYYTPSLVFINNKVDILVAYSDPYQGKDTLQPDIYLADSVDSNGNLSSVSGITNGINATNPQTVPSSTLNYEIRSFNGSTTGSEFGCYFDTINQDGSATFNISVVDLSGASPVVHKVATAITVTPVPKTLTDNITAEISGLTNGNSVNLEIFEVEGAPAAGTTTGTFIIFDGSGNVVVNPSTGFTFSDNKAHVFGLGSWNSTTFAELEEVWNTTTNLADLRLCTIAPTTGVVTSGWTALTELQSITRISWQFINPGSSGMIIVAAGSDAGGRGFFEYVVNDSTSLASPGGTISKSLAIHYTGTVTQDAAIRASGISNEYVVNWVDGNGLTVELIDSNLNVLEIYNIAEANGTSTLQNLGDGRLFVDYRVQTSTSSVDKYTILDTRVSQPGPFVETPPVVSASDQTLAQGSTVAASSLFTASDSDGESIVQYDFWDSSGNGHFALNGVPQGSNQDIYVTATQLAQASYQAGAATDLLYVRANDGTQWGAWTGFHINVVAVPVLSSVAATAAFTEEGATTVLSPNLKITDAASTTVASATVSITAGAFAGDGDVLATSTAGTSIGASYNSAAAMLTLLGTDTLAHYQSVLDQVTFSAGENPTNYSANPSRTVSWVVNDGRASNNLSAVASTTVNITAVNDPPVLSSVAASVAFTAGQTVTLSPNLAVANPDDLDLVGATVSITGGTFSGDGDMLAANMTGTAINASYNSATETLTLSGSDTLAHYRSVLDSVTFSSSSQDPTNAGANPSRTVRWLANDGGAANNLSAPAATTVNIAGGNSAGIAYAWSTLSGTIAAQGISDGGQVVGYSGGYSGFLYSSGNYTALNDPQGPGNTFAQGINGSGEIVGDYYDSTGAVHGFTYIAGNYATFDNPSAVAAVGYGTVVRSINDSGEIAGYFSDSSHNWHGFLYDGSRFTTLDYPQAARTFAQGISDSGQVVGYYVDAGNMAHGFLYNGSTYASINDPSATNGTYATGINGNGEIVGFYDNASGRHGFIDMGGTFTTFDDPAGAGTNTTIFSNNDSGQIVGNYLDNSYQGFVATPVSLTSSITIPAGAILDLTSAYSGTVNYASSTGTLKIETSSGFTGTIAGQLATTDVIDLADVSYASLQTPTYSGNNSPGTLTVSDGTHTAHLAFSGNYSLASFQTSNDGKGGTNVIDPPLSTSTDSTAPQSSAAPDLALLGNYMASAFVPSAPAGGSDPSLSQAQPEFIAPPQHA